MWHLAWPTMVQNLIGGLQGIIDQAMVGNFVGHTGNAAIGVSSQIFILVIVFVVSVFTGMGVLVARFAGAGDVDKVNRSVYQAFLVSVVLAVGVLAPLGYWLAPTLLALVNAAPEVQIEALPYIRIQFVFSIGMLMFFMFSGALRAAGDAKTPMRLGILMTALNIMLNVRVDPRVGTDPGVRDTWRGDGDRDRQRVHRPRLHLDVVLQPARDPFLAVDVLPAGLWASSGRCSSFGLPAGFQGIAMNLGGVLMYPLHRVAPLQRGSARRRTRWCTRSSSR